MITHDTDFRIETVKLAKESGTFCNHFNNSGFWLVKSLFDLKPRVVELLMVLTCQ